MSRSYHAMKALMRADGPARLRWVLERSRAANHQQTQTIALPSALYEYFAGARESSPTLRNRTAHVRNTSRLTSRSAWQIDTDR